MDAVTDAFYVVLQKGIEGGFAPPTASARATITRASKSGIFIISTEQRPHGSPILKPVVSRELKVAEYAPSIVRLQEILTAIPTQYRGAEDLYGRNTSIVHVTDPFKTQELHLSGSQAGSGVRQPTEEEKVLFDEAVGIIEKWGDPKGPSQ